MGKKKNGKREKKKRIFFHFSKNKKERTTKTKEWRKEKDKARRKKESEKKLRKTEEKEEASYMIKIETLQLAHQYLQRRLGSGCLPALFPGQRSRHDEGINRLQHRCHTTKNKKSQL